MVFVALFSVWIPDRPHFGKQLLIRSTICSLCNFEYFSFDIDGWVLVLIASIPVFCI